MLIVENLGNTEKHKEENQNLITERYLLLVRHIMCLFISLVSSYCT